MMLTTLLIPLNNIFEPKSLVVLIRLGDCIVMHSLNIGITVFI